MRDFIALFSGLLALGGCIPYALAVFFRGARPVRSTWICWLSIDLAVYAGMRLAGKSNWQIVGVMPERP